MVKIGKTEMTPDTLMAYIIFVIGMMCFIGLGCFAYIQSVSLKKNGVYTNAVIFDIGPGAKGRVFAGYEFKVNGKPYRGYVRYSPRRDTTVYIGDSCRIKYDTINPKNNELDKYYRRKKRNTIETK